MEISNLPFSKLDLGNRESLLDTRDVTEVERELRTQDDSEVGHTLNNLGANFNNFFSVILI
jgi:hypothetical protein